MIENYKQLQKIIHSEPSGASHSIIFLLKHRQALAKVINDTTIMREDYDKAVELFNNIQNQLSEVLCIFQIPYFNSREHLNLSTKKALDRYLKEKEINEVLDQYNKDYEENLEIMKNNLLNKIKDRKC
jgi:hypothetical protein